MRVGRILGVVLSGCFLGGVSLSVQASGTCPAGMDCEGHLTGVVPSAATVVTFEQKLDEEAADIFNFYDKDSISRRYLRYVPKDLPKQAVPLLLVFHGANVEAETTAWSENAGDFERLANEKKFILVYANAFSAKPDKGWKYPGVWQACRGEHEREAPDVSYVREIVAQLDKDYSIDHQRIYAAGVSNGGGMAFGLALEAPDLVSAVVAAIPVPFSPKAPGTCLAKPGHEKVSVMMMSSTDDPILNYAARGMERIRDQWLETLGVKDGPVVERLPDLVSGDAMKAPSSYLERFRYPRTPGKGEFWFYKMEGAGHATPHPTQYDPSLWQWLGKRNQDAHFSDLVWEFVSRQHK